MKNKTILTIVIIIAILVIAVGVYLYLQKPEVDKECNGNNIDYCDKSCNSNEDCAKGADCGCYNKIDAPKVEYDDEGRGMLWHVCGSSLLPNCGCVNNICTNVE